MRRKVTATAASLYAQVASTGGDSDAMMMLKISHQVPRRAEGFMHASVRPYIRTRRARAHALTYTHARTLAREYASAA